jgi:hypothetical protein
LPPADAASRGSTRAAGPKEGREYKTRNNTIRNNDMTFEGAACAGGVSDVNFYDKNYAVIDGNNSFDGDVYRVSQSSGPARFFWGTG